MPVHRTTTEGHAAMQWGEHGHPYLYTPGDPASRAAAEHAAARQGQAAHAHGFQEDDAEPAAPVSSTSDFSSPFGVFDGMPTVADSFQTG